LTFRALKDGITRRDFIARTALASVGVALGCKDSTNPVKTETPSLDHIIIVTMENRSFDHLLGWLPGSDGKQGGLSFTDNEGVSHSTFHLTSTNGCGLAGPSHSFEGGRDEYNDGNIDGWLTAEGNDVHAIGYYEQGDLPFLAEAATGWLVLDRYFCPMLGPTFPNRMISIAGQTDRLSNTLGISTLPTIWDRLAAAGKTSGVYGTTFNSTFFWGARYSSIVKPVSSFAADAASGNLPNVSYVDPELTSDISNSYHPPGDIRNGEAFMNSIYKAVTTGPRWKNSLLIITFDEWGGFFDHVVPDAAPIPQGERDIGNTDGLRGFRVPTILVSPFVKRGSISSRVYDHTSILKLIETRWNLAPLSVRDAGANDLMAEIDLTIPVTLAPQFDVASGPFTVPCNQ
jgi:phospholipase C